MTAASETPTEPGPPRASDPESRQAPAASRGPTLALAGLLLGFVLLATAYNLVVPVFEAPDEHTHFFFAQHVADTGRLPVQTNDADTRGPWEQEGSQPPLYYLLAAPLVRLAGADLDEQDLWYNHQNTMGHPVLVGNENRFIHAPRSEGWPWHGYALATHLARAMSTLMGAATVLLVWWIAGRVLLGREWLAVAAAAAVAFLPQFVFTSASLSNDNLIIVLATAALALTLRVGEGHDDWPTVAALSVAAGLAPVAKLSGLAVLGFTLASLAGIAWLRRDARLFARTGIPVAVSALVLSAWWYVRNWRLYGDVTGISHMLPGHTRRDFEMADWLAGLPSELVGMWYSAWGLFGWFTIMLPQWVYVLATVLTVAAIAGLVIAALRKEAWISWSRLAWLGVWAAVVFISLLRWLTIAKGAHGRLLFPALAFAAVAMVAGWRALVPTRIADRALFAIVTCVFLASSLFSLAAVIAPAFAGPATMAADELPGAATRGDTVFGDGLRLLAAEMPARAQEGEYVPIKLYWQSDAPIQRDGFVTVRVDQSVLQPDTDAVGGYSPSTTSDQPQLSYIAGGTTPPALLEPGAHVYVDSRRVLMPPLAERSIVAACEPRLPLEARVSVHLYEPEAGEAWPAFVDGSERSGGDWSGSILLEPQPDARLAPPDARKREDALIARFDNGVELLALYPSQCDSESTVEWRRTDDATAHLADVTGYVSDGTATQDVGTPHAAPHAAPDAPPRTLVTWYPTTDVGEDLTAFIHLVDDEGELVATFDRPPATHGSLRTSLWQAGGPVPTELPWWMFDDAVAGSDYTVQVGLYRPEDGSRVPAYRGDGTRWPNDAVELFRAASETDTEPGAGSTGLESDEDPSESESDAGSTGSGPND